MDSGRAAVKFFYRKITHFASCKHENICLEVGNHMEAGFRENQEHPGSNSMQIAKRQFSSQG